MEPRPDTGDHCAVVNGDRHVPASGAKGLLQAREHVRVTVEPAQLPFPLERSAQTTEVARGRREIRLLDRDVVEADDGVDVDRMRIGLLTDDLAVHLALGWNVDHELSCHTRGTSEATACRQPSVGVVRALDLTNGREVRGSRDDCVLGVLPFAHFDLAASADATATADGVDVDSESACCIEHRRAALETTTPARRREDDEVLRHCYGPMPRCPASAGLRGSGRAARTRETG